MSRSFRKCVICNKKEYKCRDENIFFAAFPLEYRRCKEWIRLVGNPELVFLPIEKLHKVRYVCGDHFDSKSFNRKRTRLKKTAIPSLKLVLPPLTEEQLDEFPLHVQSYVKGDRFMLHKFPDPVKFHIRFRTWTFAIGGNILTLGDDYVHKYRRVCHAHFEKRYWTWSKMLSKNAVPTLHLKDNVVARSADDASSSSASTYPSTLQISKKKVERPDGNHLSPSTSQHHSGIQLSSDTPQILNKEMQRRQSLLAAESYVGAEEVIEETVVSDDGDFVQDDVLPTDPPPPEGPFSWQRNSIPLPCDTETDGVIDLEEDPEVFMYDDDGALAKGKGAGEDAGEANTEQVEHHYRCNSCDTLISGPRYTCVQCADYDVCGACDARGAHSLHYVLRVPQHRPHSELQAVLQTIRRVLLSDGVIQLDGTQIKSEVKEEPAADPIGVEPAAGGGGAGGGGARGAAEDVSDTEVESQARTDTEVESQARTDTEVESQARTDTEEDVTDDDASWEPHSPPSPRTSPRRPHTRITELDVQAHDPVTLQVLIPETATALDQSHATTAIKPKNLPVIKLVSKLEKVNFSMLKQFGATKRKLIPILGNAKVRVLNPSEVSYVDETRVAAPSRAVRGAGPSDSRALEHARLVKPDGTVIKVTNLVKQAHVNVTRLREDLTHSATHKS